MKRMLLLKDRQNHMKFFSSVILIIFLLGISCSSHNKKTHQSKEKKDCEFLYKLHDSLDVYYCKKYYKTGELQSEGKYIENVAVEWHKFYKTNGDLEKEIEYVWLTNDSLSTVNQVIKFNRNGDTIKTCSNYFKIYSEKDTIALGDTFYAKIVLEAPYWNSSEVQFWFDVPHDTSLLRNIYTGNQYVSYDYKPNDTGIFYISGYFEESIIDSNRIKIDSTLHRTARVMHFDYKYYVTNKN